MYRIYGKGGQRHLKISWLLSEMQIPHETIAMDLSPQGPDYVQLLKLNPFGKVPILQKDDFVMWESAAIMTYLIDAHRERPMAPAAGTHERAKHDMIFFAAHTDLEEPLWTIAKHKFVYPENLRSESAVQAARFDWMQKANVLETVVPREDFLFGEQFTAADITLAYILNWAMKIELLQDFKNLQSYLQRCKKRPCSSLA
jgi:glutathione S-transferase